MIYVKTLMNPFTFIENTVRLPENDLKGTELIFMQFYVQIENVYKGLSNLSHWKNMSEIIHTIKLSFSVLFQNIE